MTLGRCPFSIFCSRGTPYHRESSRQPLPGFHCVRGQPRCQANMAHATQSGPDSGLGFQVKNLKTYVVPSPLGSGKVESTVHHGKYRGCHQPSKGEQLGVSNCLDVYNKSQDSGERQYKSRTCKRWFDPALRASGDVPCRAVTCARRVFLAEIRGLGPVCGKRRDSNGR